MSGLPACLAAQTIQQRIGAAASGTVHLSYPARRLPEATRRSAVFWLAQVAGKAPALALDSIAFDDSFESLARTPIGS